MQHSLKWLRSQWTKCAHLHDNFVYFPSSQLDSEFDMVAELAFTMRKTTEWDSEDKIDEIEEENKENKDKMYNDENKDIGEYDKNEEEMQTLNIYEMEKGTISMLGKMNIKLPSPTQFDGCCPQFNEWAGQDKYTSDEVTKLNTTYPNPVAAGEDGYYDYMESDGDDNQHQEDERMRGDIFESKQMKQTSITRFVTRSAQSIGIFRLFQLPFSAEVVFDIPNNPARQWCP
eukprot:6478406-Amphidinium_carterae.2